MPRCQHEMHVKDVIKRLVKGYDPARRRWEYCDEGFVITRREYFGERKPVLNIFGEVIRAEDKSPHSPYGIKLYDSSEAEYFPSPEETKQARQKSRQNAGPKTQRFQRRAEARRIPQTGLAELAQEGLRQRARRK